MLKKIILMVLVLSGILIASAKAAEISIIGPHEGLDGHHEERTLTVDTCELLGRYPEYFGRTTNEQGYITYMWWSKLDNYWMPLLNNKDFDGTEVFTTMFITENEYKTIKMFEEMN